MNSENPDKRETDPMSVDAISNLAAKSGAHAVTTALARAADATGVGFDVLYNMAKRESSLDPNAKASTSSAAGLFQFVDQTWLGMVKKHGAEHGLAAEADAITRSASGKFVVNDPQKREEILSLRFNPAKAAALAAELVNDNRMGLEQRLGRAVSNAEIYAAHFLGPGGAAKLLSASGEMKAADLLPKAAAANRGVFYDGERARTVSEVIASIEKSMAGAAKAPPLETKSASFHETVFSARASEPAPRQHAPYAAPTGGERIEQALARGYALFGERSEHAMTPLRLAILQTFDPTRLDARRDDKTRY